MITPYEDKVTIKAILDTDSYIQRAGFKPDNIRTSKYGADTLNVPNDNLRIFIYNGVPESSGSHNQRGVVYNITVAGKLETASRVDNVSQQIVALLSETNIGRSHILYLLDSPIQLDSDPSLYVVECSFISYETIYNKVKK